MTDAQTDTAALPLDIPDHQPRETKEDAFVRMAEARVARAVHAIRLIGNLSNRGQYDYSQADFETIRLALTLALQDMEARFRRNLPQPDFKLRR